MNQEEIKKILKEAALEIANDFKVDEEEYDVNTLNKAKDVVSKFEQGLIAVDKWDLLFAINWMTNNYYLSGGCDHSVNICWCNYHMALRDLMEFYLHFSEQG